MGLLNNNNHRSNKRNTLRKQIGNPFAQGQGQTYSVLQSAQNQPNYVMQSSGNTPLQSNNLLANASGANTGLVSGGGGGGGNMMGYMQMAAAATPMVMGFIQARQQKNLAEKLETERLAKDEEVAGLLANRQEIRNPYANLAVATEAAEFQAQQVDQSLANTLDAMQAGGFGAGGATALAREAAKAKQGISADIQKQEATNQRFFAQGEQIRQNMQEQRSIDDIDFARAQSDNLRQQEMDALTARQASQQAGVGGTMQMAQSIMSNPEAMSQISGLFGG
jgi:hypothetical protein